MGYGVAQKRAKVTNSIAKVSEKTLTVGANANPAQALAGAVSGVKVDITSGSPAATPSITIRGGSNYNGGSNEPLVIVDGVIRSSMSDINPNDIESMDVMKDAGATALYGARAGNGVIIITTKQGKSGKADVTFNAKVGLNYYNLGYNMCSDQDYLYYYRLALQNCEWTLPGGKYASAYNSNLYGTNNPGGIGRTELSQGQSYNILRKTDDNAYLLQNTDCAQVAHDKTVKSAFFAKKIRHKFMIFSDISAIYFIIRTHNRPRFGFLNCILKYSKINLMQCSFVNGSTYRHSSRFLIICHKMFNACANAHALDTVNMGCRNLRREIRIFGIIFEITSAKRRTLNIYRRSEQYRHIL